ncbi:MAG: hypothetical protein UHI81_02960 [Olegusella sp.]|nr:hypothetical protein [Olegusella sp.]
MGRDPLADFYKGLRFDGAAEYRKLIDTVLGKLESHYYDADLGGDHGLVVGSIGRGTAVAGASDVDLLFDLPKDEYQRYDDYDGNGQTALLQDVKGVLEERYPQTEMRGDGQAVVIEFKNPKITIELVPAFLQTDGSYKYPDTHSGGSWKKTDPVPEQDACIALFKKTEDEGLHLCNALRVWKNNTGFKFKGLLIDTLVNDFFEEGDRAQPCGFDDRYDILIDLFELLTEQSCDKSYWHALGSNQKIYNNDGGVFIRKARKAKKMLSAAESREEREDALIDLFGRRFADCVDVSSSERALASKYLVKDTEQFVEDEFGVDIRYRLAIDCRVTQKGFRTCLLRDMLSKHTLLPVGKSLEFYVTDCDVPEPYYIYWKVRNVGEAAYRRDNIRGQIVMDEGKHRRKESTRFCGPHFVECYAMKNGVCVARTRIDVPIDNK